MSNNYEKDKCYVVSMNKFAKFIEDIPVNEVYTFATEWDGDEFVHDAYNCNKWFVFKKIDGFNGDEIFVVGEYDGGNVYCFSIDDKFSNNMKSYIGNFTNGTTINGYVCLDPNKDER